MFFLSAQSLLVMRRCLYNQEHPLERSKENERKRILGQIDDFPLRLPKILSLNSRVWDNLNEPLSRRK